MSRNIGLVLIVAGMLAFLSASALWAYNGWQEAAVVEYSEQMSHEFLLRVQEDLEIPQDPEPAGSTLTAVEPESPEEDINTIRLADGEVYIGLLGIPALNLNLPINRDLDYRRLRNTPCRYFGTIEDNTLVIAAHNYASHFRDIAYLPLGEPVVITDTEGTEHLYFVAEVVTVQPGETHYVVNSDYDLTLFTCTYSGQARVVVRCARMQTAALED